MILRFFSAYDSKRMIGGGDGLKFHFIDVKNSLHHVKNKLQLKYRK